MVQPPASLGDFDRVEESTPIFSRFLSHVEKESAEPD